jgi:hypothetical protein
VVSLPDRADDRRVPPGLALDRHRDWVGRSRYLWIKRVLTIALLAFVALALLNVFGQRATASSATGKGATMTLTTPSHLRLGLIFQTHIDINTRRLIQHPVIVLGHGWFDGYTLNSMEPAAGAETPVPGGVAFAYPRLAAGGTLTLWLEWSVNPTHVAWNTPQTIELLNGNRRLLADTVHVDVFP